MQIRRYILAVLAGICFLAPVRMQAQFTAINFDARTLEAMMAAFLAQRMTEQQITEATDSILASYWDMKGPVIAIFGARLARRQALRNLGLWDSQENVYYKRILRLIEKGIIPKTYEITQLMLQDPATAIYWGNYLCKVCDQTISLCSVFESVVTNGSLSFRDIPFPRIKDDVRRIFSSVSVSADSVMSQLDQLKNLRTELTKEELLRELVGLGEAILAELVEKALDKVEDATGIAVSNLAQRRQQFDSALGGSIDAFLNIAKDVERMYKNGELKLGNVLLEAIGGPQNFRDLFDLNGYRIDSWLVNTALPPPPDTYYTQEYGIFPTSTPVEVLVDYVPVNGPDIATGGEWIVQETTNPNTRPNTVILQEARENSENHAGVSKADVNQVAQENPEYDYEIKHTLNIVDLTEFGNLWGKAYAYSIMVTRKAKPTPVYTEIFDSQKMSLDTFMELMNARAQNYAAAQAAPISMETAQAMEDAGQSPDDIEEVKYEVLPIGDQHAYRMASEDLLKRSEHAIVTVACTDEDDFDGAETVYKCSKCKNADSSHAHTCSMKTSIDDETADSSSAELEKAEDLVKALDNSINDVNSQIDALTAENQDLLAQVRNATDPAERDAARQKAVENRNKIEELEKKREELMATRSDALDAIEELKEDSKEEDSYQRIPYLLQTLADTYHMVWDEQGWQSQRDYVAVGHILGSNTQTSYRFKASLKTEQERKKFLGLIKIRDAKIGIDWRLSGIMHSAATYETLDFDEETPASEKKRMVDEVIDRARAEFPNCSIDVEYIEAVKDSMPEDNSNERTIHLLWASDRLAVAMDVHRRLMEIYSTMISYEKMMQYKVGWMKLLKEVLPDFTADKYRPIRQSAAELALRRWKTAGRKAKDGDFSPDSESTDAPPTDESTNP